MSSLQRPHRIGAFNVRCYHDCIHAAAIHAELKKLHIDAAVVDHAFILSPLQLATAFFRVESNVDFALSTSNTSKDSQPPQQEQLQSSMSPSGPMVSVAAAALPGRKVSYSRRIFASLSLTHNLDRIMQILPPGPQTSSVVILYHSPCAPSSTLLMPPVRADATESHRTGAVVSDPPSFSVNAAAVELERSIEAAITQTLRSTNPTAAEHSFDAVSDPFWCCSAVQYAEVAKLMAYYNVSETMLQAAQRTLTRKDLQRVSESAKGTVEEALRWHALELCITTQLAACTA